MDGYHKSKVYGLGPVGFPKQVPHVAMAAVSFKPALTVSPAVRLDCHSVRTVIPLSYPLEQSRRFPQQPLTKFLASFAKLISYGRKKTGRWPTVPYSYNHNPLKLHARQATLLVMPHITLQVYTPLFLTYSDCGASAAKGPRPHAFVDRP